MSKVKYFVHYRDSSTGYLTQKEFDVCQKLLSISEIADVRDKAHKFLPYLKGRKKTQLENVNYDQIEICRENERTGDMDLVYSENI